jgi:HK97 family phage portal protein
VNLIRRALALIRRSSEGQVRPGPYWLGDGWLSTEAGRFINWWQMGHSLSPGGAGGAMVEACVSAYAQTIAMCPGAHWRATPKGGRERIDTSALARILLRPNDYQSMSDLLLNLTRALYVRGEAFALAVRNGREEVEELHWMRDGWPVLAEDGAIFYLLAGNEIVERRFDLSAPVPARDVLHVRLHTPRHPLKGESPILAAALEMQMSGAALTQQVAFYLNQARPSFLLETEQKLTRAEAVDLRQRWEEQTVGLRAGGTPILAWGMKAKPVTVGAKDAELAELLKLTEQNVALAFRIPLQILGIGGTPFASTEALMASWKAMGLGFALNHIEEAFGLLFRLRGFPGDYVEFDTNALLRSSFKEMIDALSSGTRRVMTINEARRYIDLPEVAGGDEIRVQQQDVPLSYGAALKPPAPSPAAAAGDEEEAADGGADDEKTAAAVAAKLSIFRAHRADRLRNA